MGFLGLENEVLALNLDILQLNLGNLSISASYCMFKRLI
jgi:hypothetical protein